MTFDALLDKLATLGRRHKQIRRAYISGTGEAPAGAKYPLLLIEADPLCEELTEQLDSYSFAIQILDRERDARGEYAVDAEEVAQVLTRTKEWATQILQQLRAESPGWLGSLPAYLGLPQCAGTDLATGWRVEFRLKVPREINRGTNSAYFEAE